MKILKKVNVFIIFCLILVIILFIIKSQSVNKKGIERYCNQVLSLCDKYDLPPELVFAIIHSESSFCSHAKSKKGAIGLMQLMPSTANFIAKKINYCGVIDLFNSDCNLELGCAYIAYLTGNFIDEKTLICAYNAGEGRVKEWLLDTEYSKDGVTLFLVPFDETRRYLKKVEFFTRKYYNYLKQKGIYGKNEERQSI